MFSCLFHKVPDVSVLGLASCDSQDNDTKNSEHPECWVAHGKVKRVVRINCLEDFGVPENPWQSLQSDPWKPNEKHEPAEESADFAGSSPLRFEQDKKTDDCGRNSPFS